MGLPHLAQTASLLAAVKSWALEDLDLVQGQQAGLAWLTREQAAVTAVVGFTHRGWQLGSSATVRAHDNVLHACLLHLLHNLAPLCRFPALDDLECVYVCSCVFVSDKRPFQQSVSQSACMVPSQIPLASAHSMGTPLQ